MLDQHMKPVVLVSTSPPPGINSDCKAFLTLSPNISKAAPELKTTLLFLRETGPSGKAGVSV